MLRPSVAIAPDDLVEVGRVVGAYGIKGWIKVQPYSASADALLAEAPDFSARQALWWLTRQASVPAPISYAVRAVKKHGAVVVAQLTDIDDRDQAVQLSGMSIHISRRLFPPPAEDEYYWIDLIGCTVFGMHDGAPVLLGTVDQVLDNGAHALLQVLRQCQMEAGGPLEAVRDTKGRPVEVLIPFVQAHISHVDLAGRRIDSNWALDF
jgi:16S rRNA processing protein RimM